MAQIYTHEFVRDYFKKHGCELISEFKNVKQILSYRCVCGEIGTTNFYSFRNSHHKKCNKCVRKKAKKPNKLDFEYVKKFFKENNCELLESMYINSSTKMAYICSCGKKDYKTWNKFRAGQRCKDCAINQNAEKQRTDFSYVENFLKEHGFSIADGKYVNTNSKMLLICPCGKPTERTWSSVKQSPRCNCSIHYRKPLKRKFTKEDLINFYWKLKNDLGRYPILEDLKKNPSSPSPSVYERKFGGWVKFLESIGVMTSDRWYVDDIETLKRMYADYSYEEINNALIKKRSKSTIQHKANSLGLKRSYKAKFGKEKFSNEYLITFLKNFYDKYNRTPVAKDFVGNDLNYDTFTNRFGSWNNALKKAGLPINMEKKDFTDDDLFKMKEMYLAGDSIQEIANHFNYSHSASIYYQLKKMNVNLSRNNRWSEKQIQYLKSHYPNTDWCDLLKNLTPFSKEDIIWKASKLGIHRDFVVNFSKVRKFISLNGDLCLSESEMKITNFLYQNDIKYKKEVFYSEIINDSEAGKLRCDWLINNIIVEYFGLVTLEAYRKKVLRKKKICQKNNITLISLYPRDLEDNFDGLKKKFKNHNILA
ncbi:homing endonuclease associated repeat-containing protein [Bacillus licheniformis]|uniref:homing endonuclease associated repeat-containing protein n=1 Tax=Bacillus licheniformis TaxID=1402 RepID=UPI003CF369B6